jgi:HAD superfamily hydrolase (TIGR01549 family)
MKHWVFDLDGTLVDSLTVHFQSLEKVFGKFNQPFSKHDHHEVLKVTAKTLPHYFESRLGAENVAPAMDLFRNLTAEALEFIKPFAGIENLLKTLKQQGFELAVWTARDLAATREILKHTGLESYFSICVSGSCTLQGKPNPEGLQKIADYFSSDPSTMVMVGDFESDMLGAQAFGIKAIRVLWHSSVENKKCEIAEWQFNEVSEFQKWLDANFVG